MIELLAYVLMCYGDTFYEIHIDLAFVFGLYLTAVGALKTFFNQFIRWNRWCSPSHFPLLSIRRRHLMVSPPDIIGEFFRPDTCNERTRMYAEAQFKIRLALAIRSCLFRSIKSHPCLAGGNHVYRMGLIGYRSPRHTYMNRRWSWSSQYRISPRSGQFAVTIIDLGHQFLRCEFFFTGIREILKVQWIIR